MRIPRFYQPGPLALGARVSLSKDAAHHAVRVLRLVADAKVRLFNGDGCEYQARILRIEKTDVVVLIESSAACSVESPLMVHLLQGISSGERMDYTLQKAVELGISAIQPIQAERSVVKLSGERREKRLQHWKNIVASACEQCGRNTVPTVHPALPLADWLGQVGAEPGALRIHLSPDAPQRLRDIPKPAGPVWLAVGPEGGFSDNEHVLFNQFGFVPVRLGARVLRTETAALAALASLQTLWGDF